MDNTLLLTWTFKPYSEVKNTWYNHHTINSFDREKEYFDALVYYITQSNFNYIVFVENSNSRFSNNHLEIINYLLSAYWKHFEYLSFLSDKEKIKDRWYNYWEWECIDYAYKNSSFLKRSKNWDKITWRYKCLNINEITNDLSDTNRYFYRFSTPWIYWVATSIFKCNNEVYWKCLYNTKTLVDFKNPDFLRSYEMMCYYNLRNILTSEKKTNLFPIFHTQKNCWILKNPGAGNLRYSLTIWRFSRSIMYFWSPIDRFLSYIFDKFYCNWKLKLQ